MFMGRTLLDGGDPDRALSALRESLAVADRMLARAPSSMSHQLDRAEALEAIGRCYLAAAAKTASTTWRRPGAVEHGLRDTRRLFNVSKSERADGCIWLHLIAGFPATTAQLS